MTLPGPDADQVQCDLYYKLLSEELFAPIVIFKLWPQRTSSEIDERLAALTGDYRQGPLKKPGAAITVGLPTLTNLAPSASTPLAELTVVITVRENPRINIEAKDANGAPTGTGITAVRWAQNIFQVLQPFTLIDVCQTLYAIGIKENTSFEHLDQFAQDVTIRATFPLQAPLKVGDPINSLAGQTVTLAESPSTGANPQPPNVVIYYTIDGSFPGSGNPKALVYNEPFTVALDTVVRWAGYAPGWVGSDACRATVEEV